MQETLLEQGLTLMLAGMGTVFAFLTTLVLVMTLMATALKRFQPKPVAEASGPSNEEVAAITAAIKQHRR